MSRVLLNLIGREVTRCYVDYAFGLQFWDQNSGEAEVRISGSFELRIGESKWNLHTEEQRSSLAPALDLLTRKVMLAQVESNGTLRLEFEPDIYLIVPADPDYESWSIVGPGDLAIHNLPGGGYSVYGSQGLEPQG